MSQTCCDKFNAMSQMDHNRMQKVYRQFVIMFSSKRTLFSRTPYNVLDDYSINNRLLVVTDCKWSRSFSCCEVLVIQNGHVGVHARATFTSTPHAIVPGQSYDLTTINRIHSFSRNFARNTLSITHNTCTIVNNTVHYRKTVRKCDHTCDVYYTNPTSFHPQSSKEHISLRLLNWVLTQAISISFISFYWHIMLLLLDIL